MVEINYFEQVELQDPVTSVALAPSLLDLTRQIVRESLTPERYEQGGFFGGVIRNGVLFLWDNRQTAIGDGGKCFLYDKFGKTDGLCHIDVDMHQRTMQAMPDFRMVRYHSHPLTTEKTLRSELGKSASPLIEAIRQELDSGIYDSLEIRELDAALNEACSRQLSQDDVDQTNGRYHLLISPTVYVGRPFSHLNFYDLRADGERVVPIRLATRKELAPFMKLDKKVHREWKRANFGTKPLWRMTQEETRAAYFKLYRPQFDENLPMHKGGMCVL